eukprot:Amastigsp_a510603_23.p2 type:complete len:134 gc:universal Amastigsp_a510603_23:475-876(+)
MGIRGRGCASTLVGEQPEHAVPVCNREVCRDSKDKRPVAEVRFEHGHKDDFGAEHPGRRRREAHCEPTGARDRDLRRRENVRPRPAGVVAHLPPETAERERKRRAPRLNHAPSERYRLETLGQILVIVGRRIR